MMAFDQSGMLVEILDRLGLGLDGFANNFTELLQTRPTLFVT